MGEYRMPSLGADMDAGKVVKWLIEPGDRVHRGDVVAQVETEKAVIDAEIFEDGVVDSLLVPEGELVPVGTPLARVITEGAAAVSPPKRSRQPTRQRAATVPAGRPAPAPAAQAPVTQTTPPREARRASPYARNRAQELGIDLSTIHGSGPSGAIVAGDVERAAATPRAVEPQPPLSERLAPSTPEATAADERAGSMRRAIGALMARSKREIPHYYLETTIDFGRADAWLRETNEHRPPGLRVLSATLLLKATARAARELPQMNGFYIDDAFREATGVHLGVAISLRHGGLIAPAIHDVDAIEVDQLNAQLKDLVIRARTGRLRSSEMADPTLTVTNLGDQGVETVFGVIYPPQVALVGFGKVVERLFVVDGLIGVRPLVTATLSADHRVTDGAIGARFLSIIDRSLQHPEAL